MSTQTPEEKFLIAMSEAVKAAATALDGNDGGSSNLDSIQLKNPPSNFKEICKQVGTLGFDSSEEGWIEISEPYGRQGFERTAQCEAMVKVLKAHGYTAYVQYVMD